MILNFGKLFQHFSKDKSMRGLVRIPDDSSLWPDEWKTVTYKTYSRFPKISLLRPSIQGSFEEVLLKRNSVREWYFGPPTLQQLSTMLYYVSGIKDQDLYKNTQTRMLPSGGARYPIEIYIVVFKQGELEERLYHYNVKENSLDVLWRVSKEERDKLFSYEWASGAGMAIFITGVVHRATMKYGERGYRYMYYEAGAIAALLQVIACSVELNAVLMGGTNDENVEDLLGINAERESLFLAILSG